MTILSRRDDVIWRSWTGFSQIHRSCCVASKLIWCSFITRTVWRDMGVWRHVLVRNCFGRGLSSLWRIPTLMTLRPPSALYLHLIFVIMAFCKRLGEIHREHRASGLLRRGDNSLDCTLRQQRLARFGWRHHDASHLLVNGWHQRPGNVGAARTDWSSSRKRSVSVLTPDQFLRFIRTCIYI